VAKRDKNLSQAEIDALAAQAEDANLPTETAEPGIADAEDMPSPPARGARTLSQEEIDAILFTDSDKEPTSVEDTTVVEEITPTDEPPPLRKTPATRKTKPSRKIRPPEEVTVIEELPPAEEVFAADELDEEEVPLEGSLVELAQRMDRVEASCERLDHATSWIESISDVTERLQTIEATLATLVQMERNEEDIDDILDRLRKIEETTDIDAVLERLRDIQATASKTSLVKENFNVVESEIAKLSGRIEAITATLKDSIGYGIHRDFSCRSCGSKGHVAITIRCTHCGKEGWMGWWPEK
jgi:DNA mismatch repair ATPase MutL